MDEPHEQEIRKQAIRWWLRKIKRREICRRLKRSRNWLKKWIKRYHDQGWAGVVSQSRAPQTHPQAFSAESRDEMARAREYLERQPVGLIGAKSIRRELEHSPSLERLPSKATVYRVLGERQLTGTWGDEASTPTPAYFPQPHETTRYVLYQTDWTEKYLAGGPKVYAFHSVDLSDQALWQTIAGDKNGVTVKQHLLETCQHLGIPDGWQLDHDAAFCGGYKVPRVCGACVRLCLCLYLYLYLGSEPIFIPVREPQRNGRVERVNGLWAQAFWERQHFACVADVQQAQPEFTHCYEHGYLGSAPTRSIAHCSARRTPRPTRLEHGGYRPLARDAADHRRSRALHPPGAAGWHHRGVE